MHTDALWDGGLRLLGLLLADEGAHFAFVCGFRASEGSAEIWAGNYIYVGPRGKGFQTAGFFRHKDLVFSEDWATLARALRFKFPGHERRR